MTDYAALRARMVNNQLRTFDVADYRVQNAFLRIPRERFVPAPLRPLAYCDQMLLVAEGTGGAPPRQMMQPAVLARLIQLADVREDDVALVVGALAGYSTAIMAELAVSVLGLECDEELAARAAAHLEALDVENAAVVTASLPQGYPKEAPFDVILVNGAVEDGLSGLFDQLKDGGRLVVVEGLGLAGRARRYTRSGDVVSGWTEFNGAAPLLPGFQKAAAFVFE